MSCLGPPSSHTQVILFLLLSSAVFAWPLSPLLSTRWVCVGLSEVEVLFSCPHVSHRAVLTGLTTFPALPAAWPVLCCSPLFRDLVHSSASQSNFGFPLNTEIPFLAQEVSALQATRTWDTGLGSLHYVHALVVCSS